MKELMTWDPFQAMAQLPTIIEGQSTFAPAFDVKETPESFVFSADVPGLKEQDLDVSVTGNRLSVSGKREAEKEEKTDTYYTYERNYGSFSRTFTLPEDVNSEQARADLKDGVLTLVLPKKPEAQAKKIAVKPGEKVKA
jgi:HSP20 family protein